MKRRIAEYLEIAHQHGIRTMFVLFDICNFSPFRPVPGKTAGGDSRQVRPCLDAESGPQTCA